MTRYRAQIEQRCLHVSAGGRPVIDFPLDQGGRYRLVASRAAELDELIAALERHSGFNVLPGHGGLLGAMTVAENFALALGYGTGSNDLAAWEEPLLQALALCGMGEVRSRELMRERPMTLERIERLSLGFVRQLLRPPELLILDRPFPGLSRVHAERVLALTNVFHTCQPFRPVLFLDLDASGQDLPPGFHCLKEARLVPTATHVAAH